MGKNTKIKTMQDDLEALKNNSEEPSQNKINLEKEKTDLVAEPLEMVNFVEQIEPEKSIVEATIKAMGDNTLDQDRQETKIKKEDVLKTKKSVDNNAKELQNLVNRISETIPNKKVLQEDIQKEGILDINNSFESEVDLVDEKTEIEIKINKEIEEKIDKKIKEETTKSDRKIINKKDGADQEVEDLENNNTKELRDLIERISKSTAQKDVEKDSIEKVAVASTPSQKELPKIMAEETPLQKTLEQDQKTVVREVQQKTAVSETIIPIEDTAVTMVKKEKKSFWKDSFKGLKKNSSREKNRQDEIIQEKVNAENKIKTHDESGILVKKKEEETEQESQKNDDKKTGYLKNDKLLFPEDRLVRGEQRYYSSVSKKIKLREKKDEMAGLRNATDIKEKQKILSKEEEYKQLKKSIISKYHIKLFSLAWKKIILISFIIISLIVGSFYVVMIYIPQEGEVLPPVNNVFGEELAEFADLEEKITIAESSFRGFNNLEENAKDIFNANHNSKVIKLLVINTENEIDGKILPLKSFLDAMKIIDSKNNINNLPINFLEASTNQYNTFLFQTEKESMRYGIAIKLKDKEVMFEIMKEWEKERSENKKMIVVLKPLFASDRNFEDFYNPFNSGNYGGIEIRYVHLMDQETALNYFIYHNNNDNSDLLVITTSRDSAYALIDLLIKGR